MKTYLASFVKNGILGGALYCDKEYVQYRTNKLTVDPAMRKLTLFFREMEDAEKCSLWGLPLVRITMKNKGEYTFLVFGRNSFLSLVKEGIQGTRNEVKIL